MVHQRRAAMVAVLAGLALAALILTTTVRPAAANDAYIGLGIGLSSGQPRYSQSRDLAPQAAFELTPEDWRFNFAQATFDSSARPVTHIETQVFGIEKLMVYRFHNPLSVYAGLGAGAYQVALSGAGKGSGSAFGLMADAGGRYQIEPQLFVDVQFQYRNAAVAIGSASVVDAGWTGFDVNLGFIF